MSSPVSVVILAAGKGTRMKSATPKVLHPLCGRSILAWVLDQAATLDPQKIVVVVGHQGDLVSQEAHAAVAGSALEGRLVCVTQEPQLGTGHAVQVAAPSLGTSPGTVVVLYGDMPLLRGETIEELVAQQAEGGDGCVAFLTAIYDDPHGYGRLIRDDEGLFSAIVEEKDCDDDQRMVDECNLGVYAFDGPKLLEDLPRLGQDNAQGEMYLTDIPGMAVEAGREVRPVQIVDADEGLGINDLTQLAAARWELQTRILTDHMDNGVQILDPSTAWIDHGVSIGAGTKVLPSVVIESGVQIGANCSVGPFSHLRVGTVLSDRAEIGNFTECKNTSVGEGSKAKHLSYLGDTHIGAKANIGAGTIFANYDGKKKHRTEVGDGAFIGSGTIVVAPNTVPKNSITGAGAVITRKAEMGEGETWAGLPAKRLRSN
ncbi:MAG: bifunctional UDP-N-acetylglucosamine pyrophosphorylase/glucosamine-1-phosphate N-acetyltransferase [Planctomycetota bacterium]|jgi:bifunctional UDP-N-acetylglucosamine pyrophosphorylase/glucosamine-1-phosphate N-acetyltransferase